MKGLIVWAYSNCRSVMAFYRALAAEWNVPLMVCLLHYEEGQTMLVDRVQVGFRADEFDDVEMICVGNDFAAGLRVLDAHPGWHHLFTSYQESAAFRRLIQVAHARGEAVAIGSEAPCNMETGLRRFLKKIYLRTYLPWKVRKVLPLADFFLNYSGTDFARAEAIGWPRAKIIPFGYFPPPLEGSVCQRRTTNKPFHILSTGVLSRHRGADILVEALILLKARGVAYRATITQKGELFDALCGKIAAHDLPVEMVGFVAMEELIRLYETCSVFVGAGRDEPWGMRLNDALNCGAPLVVNRGMGGAALVDEYACGLTFTTAAELADCLEKLARDEGLYAECAAHAVEAARNISPRVQAKRVVEAIRGLGWD